MEIRNDGFQSHQRMDHERNRRQENEVNYEPVRWLFEMNEQGAVREIDDLASKKFAPRAAG